MLLVTGATGYLGAALLAVMRSRGLAPLALVRTAERASALPEGVPWAVGELGDEDSLRRAARGCTSVFHLAASIGTPGGGPEQILRNNTAGTAAMLRVAKEAGVRRFVHVSSAATLVDATGLVSEEAGGQPALTDPYSVSKARAERLALDAAHELDVVVVNPASIYGPSPAGPLSYNGLLAEAAEGRVDAVVDAPMAWVLASDVANGLLLAHEHGRRGRRYVLCGQVERFGTVLHRYAELVGSPHRVRLLSPGADLPPDAPTFAQRSAVYGKLGPVHVDDRGARALGFAPKDLADGLAETAAWMARR